MTSRDLSSPDESRTVRVAVIAIDYGSDNDNDSRSADNEN